MNSRDGRLFTGTELREEKSKSTYPLENIRSFISERSDSVVYVFDDHRMFYSDNVSVANGEDWCRRPACHFGCASRVSVLGRENHPHGMQRDVIMLGFIKE